jgi:hypothetical protein
VLVVLLEVGVQTAGIHWVRAKPYLCKSARPDIATQALKSNARVLLALLSDLSTAVSLASCVCLCNSTSAL